jgi:hypothetical protein
MSTSVKIAHFSTRLKWKRKWKREKADASSPGRDVALRFADPAVLWAESISLALARIDRGVVGGLASQGVPFNPHGKGEER